MAKVFIRNIRPYVDLYQDRKSGIAWIEDGTAGVGISCHPNISDTGSIRGMRAKGWWDKKDRIVRAHGFYYNIDHLSGSGPDYETVRKTCDCGGYHGAGRAVAGGKKRHGAGKKKSYVIRTVCESACVTCGENVVFFQGESYCQNPKCMNFHKTCATKPVRCHKERIPFRSGKKRHSKATKAHQLKVISLHDAQAECSCGGWHYSFAGPRTRKELEDIFRHHSDAALRTRVGKIAAQVDGLLK